MDEEFYIKSNIIGIGDGREISKSLAEKGLIDVGFLEPGDIDGLTNILKDTNMLIVIPGSKDEQSVDQMSRIARLCNVYSVFSIAVVSETSNISKFDQWLYGSNNGWSWLNEYVDAIIVADPSILQDQGEQYTSLTEKPLQPDRALYLAVKGLTEIIYLPNLINLKFSEILSVFKKKKEFSVTMGTAKGENRAVNATRFVVDNLKLGDMRYDDEPRHLLVNFSASEDTWAMAEFIEATALFDDKVEEDILYDIGLSFDNTLGEKFRVTCFAPIS